MWYCQVNQSFRLPVREGTMNADGLVDQDMIPHVIFSLNKFEPPHDANAQDMRRVVSELSRMIMEGQQILTRANGTATAMSRREMTKSLTIVFGMLLETVSELQIIGENVDALRRVQRKNMNIVVANAGRILMQRPANFVVDPVAETIPVDVVNYGTADSQFDRTESTKPSPYNALAPNR